MHEAAAHLSGMLVSLDAVLEQEFEHFVRETSDLGVRVAFSILRQREDAEEIAQEAFTRAYPRFRELREPERFRAWIVRVTWRLAIDRWRADRRRRKREQTADDAAPAADVEQVAVDAERSERVWRAVDALPDKLRMVIVLTAIEGHDVREVARLLGIPAGTVKSRLFLARKRLAESLRCLANASTDR